jgi:hypothetical protein
MVNYLLGEDEEKTPVKVEEWIDPTPVALLVSTNTWYHSLREAIEAETGGTLAAPSVIEIRRNITDRHAMGGSAISLPAGKHISLEPHTQYTSAVYIRRWQNGEPLFTVENDASLTIKSVVIGGAGGHAVYVDNGAGGTPPAAGVFTMKTGARIGVETDVFLENGALITLDGEGSPLPGNPLARISPELPYPNTTDLPGLRVLDGVSPTDINVNNEKFDVTSETVPGWLGPRYWRVNDNGYLYHVVARRDDSVDGTLWYPTLESAFAAAVTGTSESNVDVVTLVSNVDLAAGQRILAGGGYYVRLTVPEGNTYMIRRTAATNTEMFYVDIAAYVEMTAPPDTELIIDGGAQWTGPLSVPGSNGSGITSGTALVFVSSSGGGFMGKFRLGPRVTLRNNDRIMGNGGAIEAKGAFVMDGGSVTRNRVRDSAGGSGYGGGIFLGGQVFNSPVKIISGGSVTENYALKSGGGVMMDHINGGAKLTMSGGLISGNTAAGKDSFISPALMGYGGGIFIGGSTVVPNVFRMTGGTISGNTSTSGQGNGIAADHWWFPPSELYLSGAVNIADDVHLYYNMDETPIPPGHPPGYTPLTIAVEGPMTNTVRIPITMHNYPAAGSSVQVFTGGFFDPARFLVTLPQTLGADGKIYTP